MIFSSLMPLRAFAYDEGFFAANDILFYNPDDCAATTGGSTDTGGGLVSGGNSAQAWCYLLSHGISKNGASGLIGNMMRESHVTPNLWQHGTCGDKTSNLCGYGLVQWSSQGYKWDGSDTLWKFADEQFPNTSGKVGTLQTQLDYLLHTLEKSHAGLLTTLKSTGPTVEDQAFNFFTGYEMPNVSRSDSNNVIGTTNALKAYNQHHNLPCGTNSVATTTPPTTPPSTATAATTTSGGQTVVIIDPGHANSSPQKPGVDPADLTDVNYANDTPEMKDAFDIAKMAQTKLTAAGYKAILTKDNINSVPTSYERAKFANNNDGDIAFSIHTDSGTWHSFNAGGAIYPQKVGEYRTTVNNTDIKFTNADTATKSQAYAKKFKTARSIDENNVIIKDNIFDNRPGIAPGNLSIVQLESDVPWVYNESGARPGKASNPNAGLTDTEKGQYADGLVKGVKDSIGPNAHQGGSASTNTNGCGDSGGNGVVQGDIVQTALNLAWDTSGHGPNESDAKPEYVTAKNRYNSGIVFSDCGGFVATTMIASGADTKYVKVQTHLQEAYVKAHPEKYQIIPNKSNTSNLQPGDIFVSPVHSYLYVGDGAKNGNARSASWTDHVPEASNTYFTAGDGSAFVIARAK